MNVVQAWLIDMVIKGKLEEDEVYDVLEVGVDDTLNDKSQNSSSHLQKSPKKKHKGYEKIDGGGGGGADLGEQSSVKQH